MRHRPLTPLLLLLPILAGAPLTAGEAPPAPAPAVSKAKEVMRSRNPKEAIPLLVGLIEEKRDHLEESAEALIQLVKCFQMLKGDATAEAHYAELSARYLSRPPALDGQSLPKLEEVSEDLLWKSWEPGRACRFGFLVGSVERELKLESQQGPTSHTLQIQLAVEESHAAHAPAARKLPGQDGRPKLGSGVAWPETINVVARVGDKQFPGTASVHPSDDYALAGAALRIWVTFKDFPTDIPCIDEITGAVPLTLPRQKEEIFVPLRKGASWATAQESGRITEVTHVGGRTVVKCTSEPIVGKVPLADESGRMAEVANAGGGMVMRRTSKPRVGRVTSASSSSSSSVGGNESGDAEAPISLVTPDGRTFNPGGLSVNAANGVKTMEFTFVGAEKADRLRLRSSSSLSIREVPLQVTNITLP